MSTSTRKGLRFALPAVLIAAAAAAVGAYQLLSSRGADVGLQEAELPGLTVALPDWTVSEATDDWVSGVHRRDSPRGRGRFVSVRWSVSDPITGDQVLRFLDVEGAVDVVERWEDQVHDHPGHGFLLDLQGKTFAATAWHCPIDHRAVHVVTFLELPRAELRRLHERVTASIRCHTAKPEPAAARHAAFEPPAGFTTERAPAMSLYEHPDGRAYTFTVGAPGSAMADGVRDDPQLRRHLLTSLSGDPDAALEDRPDTIRGRAVFAGRVTSEGTPLWVLLTAWSCPEPDLSFIGMFLSPAADGLEQGKLDLASAGCPGS